ncbi:hypothetical protein Pcinc_020534 [Petrolisthes cinctipes]|uniref:Uncharacterized protein n=1 Tax=Petrolisthes cinctipes TaxID=88211 RepID=A0AAE1FHW2_PETCI|nr:hypothetical protein Pcinc_020534 [Petrolisthes cinctipes]
MGGKENKKLIEKGEIGRRLNDARKEDCQILKPPRIHSPLKLELQASNEEQQLTAHFHHHPPSNPYNNNNNNNNNDDDNDNSWFLMLAFTPPNKVINWIASVAMIHSQFPGQSEYGDRLQIKCNTAIEEESNTEERSDTTATKSDWYPNQPNATLFAIRIVIGPADIQVLNRTTEQDFEMVLHKCLGPLEHFPNLTVTVACFPGNTECGSINICSNTGCRMVNVTVQRARLDHWIREDGKVETEASFQPPRFNTSWITVLIFTVPGNETVIVASVTMFHFPGLEDSLHVRCTSIMGNNDKYNDTRKDNKNDTNIFQQWTNSQKIPFRGVKIQIGSSYLQMIDTTTGKNTEMGNISYSFAQYFPNITMNILSFHHSYTTLPPLRHHSSTTLTPPCHHSDIILPPLLHHPTTTQTSSFHHSYTTPPPLRHHPSITLTPPCHHSDIILPPFLHHPATTQISSFHHSYTTLPPLRHHPSTTLTPP